MQRTHIVAKSTAPPKRVTDVAAARRRPARVPAVGNQAALRALRSPHAPVIQRKLAIGATNDPLEHEADRAADRVMRMPDPSIAGSPAPLQVSRNSASYEEAEKLQEKPAGPQGTAVPPIVHEALRSSGEPLDAGARAFMEPRFGQDFGDVRVHTGAKADESARAIHALAYSVGPDLVFASGRYRPSEAGGMRLLAHELAHVAQAPGGALPASQLRRSPDDGTVTASPAVTQDMPAEPTGISADVRPISYGFSIDNDPTSDMNSETSRFTVNNGRVDISALARWTPSSSDEPHSYAVTLVKWGLFSDTPISPVAGLSVGTAAPFNWTGLASGSYFLRVHALLNAATPNATLSGSISVP